MREIMRNKQQALAESLSVSNGLRVGVRVRVWFCACIGWVIYCVRMWARVSLSTLTH